MATTVYRAYDFNGTLLYVGFEQPEGITGVHWWEKDEAAENIRFDPAVYPMLHASETYNLAQMVLGESPEVWIARRRAERKVAGQPTSWSELAIELRGVLKRPISYETVRRWMIHQMDERADQTDGSPGVAV